MLDVSTLNELMVKTLQLHHPRCDDKIIKSHSKVLVDCINDIVSFKPNNIPDRFATSGIQIPAHTINRLSRLKMFMHGLFRRCNNSTYVATNIRSSVGVNFTHQYWPTKDMENIFKSYMIYISQHINQVTHEEICIANSRNILSKKDFIKKLDTHSYLQVKRSDFNKMYRHASQLTLSNDHVKDIGYTIRLTKKIEYSDAEYFYILNYKKLSESRDIYFDGMKEFGRQYTTFGLMPKRLRSILIPELIGYDIDSSLLTMMVNTVYHNVTTKNLLSKVKDNYPIVHQLLTDKEHFRKYTISNKTGLSIDDGKIFVTALLQDPSFNYTKFIHSHLLNNKTIDNDWIKLFVREAKELNQRTYDIIMVQPYAQRFCGYVNTNIRRVILDDIKKDRIKHPKRFGRGHKNRPKIMHRIYVLFEAHVREKLMTVCGGAIQVHDCVYSAKQIAVEKITLALKLLTGMYIPIGI